MVREIVDINKGYVKIANNLFENIIFRDFTNRERAVICLVIRLSYGFNHKRAVIKPKVRFSLIGVHRQHIDRTLDSLIDKKVILQYSNDEYALNKHFDEWEVKLNKHFDVDSFNSLKGLQFREDVTTTVTICNQENTEECNNDGYKEVTTEVTESNHEEKNEVTTTVTNFEKSNHHGYNEVTTTVTNFENMLPPRLQEQPENANGVEDTGIPKDIFKDMLNTSLNTCIKGNDDTNSSKKFDPYFNNPVVEKFKSLYEKNLKVARCYLDNFQIHKLIEISAENPDFLEKLPLIIEKYARIEFSNGINKFGIRGLINEGKWAAILNGEYDKYIKTENENFDLGIPTV